MVRWLRHPAYARTGFKPGYPNNGLLQPIQDSPDCGNRGYPFFRYGRRDIRVPHIRARQECRAYHTFSFTRKKKYAKRKRVCAYGASREAVKPKRRSSAGACTCSFFQKKVRRSGNSVPSEHSAHRRSLSGCLHETHRSHATEGGCEKRMPDAISLYP